MERYSDGNYSDSCIIHVTVVDTTSPVIFCPASIVVAADSSCGFVWNYSVQGSDDCGLIKITQTDTSGYSSGDRFPAGTTLQQWAVVDSSNNIVRCTFSITVNDSTPPTVSCPSNVVTYADSLSCETIIRRSRFISFDNCGITTRVLIDGRDSASIYNGVFPVGITTLKYYAVDYSGNSDTCTQTITVIDSFAPGY
ncbi:MAG: HYR domain-containing protein [Bacteroidia bacterium]